MTRPRRPHALGIGRRLGPERVRRARVEARMTPEERAAWALSFLFSISLAANILQFAKAREIQTANAKLLAELRSYSLEK